ncbi:MAG: hypothetical protein Kow00129_13350 [Thermoleophilia bacterium]
MELLKGAGARVRRLDLLEDESIPEEAAGLILAGHLWPEALADLAGNYQLMRHLRVRITEGMPTLALGGGMLYLLRSLQAPDGRRYELAGILPSEGELVEVLDEVAYYPLRAQRDSVCLQAGQELVGWMSVDADIMEAPVTRNFAFALTPAGAGKKRGGELLEGAIAGNLLCSRVMFHLASVEGAAERFVAACRSYQAE